MAIVASTIHTASAWGGPAVYRHWKQTVPSNQLWVVFPGQAYPLDAPLMWYTIRAALRANCDVLGVEYGFQANRQTMESGDFPRVLTEVGDAVSAFTLQNKYRRVGYAAKSLGTMVAAELAHSGSADAYIFMTPLRGTIPFILTNPRMLVMVGGQDPLFQAGDVQAISGLDGVDIYVFPEADHALEVAGDVSRSLQILAESMTRTTSFMRS